MGIGLDLQQMAEFDLRSKYKYIVVKPNESKERLSELFGWLYTIVKRDEWDFISIMDNNRSMICVGFHNSEHAMLFNLKF